MLIVEWATDRQHLCGGDCVTKGYKIVISVLTIVCSFGATGAGCGFVGMSSLKFEMKDVKI